MKKMVHVRAVASLKALDFAQLVWPWKQDVVRGPVQVLKVSVTDG